DVHLGERCAPVVELLAGYDLEAVEHGFGMRPAVGFDIADDDVRAAVVAAVAFLQHLVRLAYAWSGPEVDAQLSLGHGCLLRSSGPPARLGVSRGTGLACRARR